MSAAVRGNAPRAANRFRLVIASVYKRPKTACWRACLRMGRGRREAGFVSQPARLAMGAAPAAVAGLDAAFDDCQAEAGAAMVAVAGILDSIERGEDASQGVFGDTGAVVGDGDYNLLSASDRREGNLSG